MKFRRHAAVAFLTLFMTANSQEQRKLTVKVIAPDGKPAVAREVAVLVQNLATNPSTNKVDDFELRTTKTDEDGKFLLNNPPEKGWLFVVLRSANDSFEEILKKGRIQALKDRALNGRFIIFSGTPEEKKLAVITIDLSAKIRVTGKISDNVLKEEQPVQDALLFLYPVGQKESPEQVEFDCTFTNEKGEFVLYAARPGKHLLNYKFEHKEGVRTYEASGMHLCEITAEGASIDLPALRSVAVFVRSIDGNLIRDAISINASSFFKDHVRYVRCHPPDVSAGRFCLFMGAEREHITVMAGSNYRPYVLNKKRNTDQIWDSIDVSLEPAKPSKISGTAVNDGIPKPVLLYYGDANTDSTPIKMAWTDESGNFMFDDIPDGEYTIEVEFENREWTQQKVIAPPEGSVQVKMRKGEGKVRKGG